MPKCVAPGCVVDSTVFPQLKFFRFPRRAEKYKIWCEAIGLEYESSRRTLFVCERHFRQNQMRALGLLYGQVPAYRTGPLNEKTGNYCPPGEEIRTGPAKSSNEVVDSSTSEAARATGDEGGGERVPPVSIDPATNQPVPGGSRNEGANEGTLQKPISIKQRSTVTNQQKSAPSLSENEASIDKNQHKLVLPVSIKQKCIDTDKLKSVPLILKKSGAVRAKQLRPDPPESREGDAIDTNEQKKEEVIDTKKLRPVPPLTLIQPPINNSKLKIVRTRTKPGMAGGVDASKLKSVPSESRKLGVAVAKNKKQVFAFVEKHVAIEAGQLESCQGQREHSSSSISECIDLTDDHQSGVFDENDYGQLIECETLETEVGDKKKRQLPEVAGPLPRLNDTEEEGSAHGKNKVTESRGEGNPKTPAPISLEPDALQDKGVEVSGKEKGAAVDTAGSKTTGPMGSHVTVQVLGKQNFKDPTVIKSVLEKANLKRNGAVYILPMKKNKTELTKTKIEKIIRNLPTTNTHLKSKLLSLVSSSSKIRLRRMNPSKAAPAAKKRRKECSCSIHCKRSRGKRPIIKVSPSLYVKMDGNALFGNMNQEFTDDSVFNAENLFTVSTIMTNINDKTQIEQLCQMLIESLYRLKNVNVDGTMSKLVVYLSQGSRYNDVDKEPIAEPNTANARVPDSEDRVASDKPLQSAGLSQGNSTSSSPYTKLWDFLSPHFLEPNSSNQESTPKQADYAMDRRGSPREASPSDKATDGGGNLSSTDSSEPLLHLEPSSCLASNFLQVDSHSSPAARKTSTLHDNSANTSTFSLSIDSGRVRKQSSNRKELKVSLSTFHDHSYLSLDSQIFFKKPPYIVHLVNLDQFKTLKKTRIIKIPPEKSQKKYELQISKLRHYILRLKGFLKKKNDHIKDMNLKIKYLGSTLCQEKGLKRIQYPKKTEESNTPISCDTVSNTTTQNISDSGTKKVTKPKAKRRRKSKGKIILTPDFVLPPLDNNMEIDFFDKTIETSEVSFDDRFEELCVNMISTDSNNI